MQVFGFPGQAPIANTESEFTASVIGCTYYIVAAIIWSMIWCAESTETSPRDIVKTSIVHRKVRSHSVKLAAPTSHPLRHHLLRQLVRAALTDS